MDGFMGIEVYGARWGGTTFDVIEMGVESDVACSKVHV